MPDAPPAGAALVAHPHPAFGGHMDVWLLPVICHRMASDGWVTLRVNFRGVEGSGGVQSGGALEHLDLEGALSWLVQSVPEVAGVPLAAVGWSFGARMALRLGSAIDHWVGIAPPTREVAESPIEGVLVPDVLPPRRTVIVGEHDQFFPPSSVDVLQPDAVHVLPGTDHFFFDKDREVADLVAMALR